MELCMGEGEINTGGRVREGPTHSVLWEEYVPGVSFHQTVNFENIPLKPETLFINHTWLLLLICLLTIRIKIKYSAFIIFFVPPTWETGGLGQVLKGSGSTGH